MASIIDSFNEAFGDRLALLKFAIYGIPVFLSAEFFIRGQLNEFSILATITVLLLLTVLTCAINNVRSNNKEVITLNPLKLLWIGLKTIVAVVPVAIIFGGLAEIIIRLVPIPSGIEHFQQIFNIIVWTIAGSIILTSYLAFAKYLEIKQAYNFVVISNSCIDVVINLLFFLPQIAVVNLILFIPVFYVFYFFKFPFSHWSFVIYTSIMLIANVSILANYLAQLSYELVKGKDEEYNENHSMTLLEIDDSEKGN